jgi:prefoldin subunit 4
VDLPASEVQELLSASSARLDGEISELREQLGDLREEIQQLKVELYARFGTSINLDY